MNGIGAYRTSVAKDSNHRQDFLLHSHFFTLHLFYYPLLLLSRFLNFSICQHLLSLCALKLVKKLPYLSQFQYEGGTPIAPA